MNTQTPDSLHLATGQGKSKETQLRVAQLGKFFINKGLKENRRLLRWAVARDRRAEKTPGLVEGLQTGLETSQPEEDNAMLSPEHSSQSLCLSNDSHNRQQKLSREGPKCPIPSLERKRM